MSTKKKSDCQLKLVDTGLTWDTGNCDPLADIKACAEKLMETKMTSYEARHLIVSLRLQMYIEQLYFRGRLLSILKQIIKRKNNG